MLDLFSITVARAKGRTVFPGSLVMWNGIGKNLLGEPRKKKLERKVKQNNPFKKNCGDEKVIVSC